MPDPIENSPVIVLFEDEPECRADKVRRLQEAVGPTVRIIPYTGEEINKKGRVELNLEALLRTEAFNKGHIGLIISDRELGKYKNAVVSDSVVSAVAEQMGLPICLYERGNKSTGNVLSKFKQWKTTGIIVDGDSDDFGSECAGIFNGFKQVGDELEKISRFKDMTPPEILAKILGNDEETDSIALYGAGEQSVLLELLPYYDASKKNSATNIKKRYPRVLGNWLYTSILRYPGILLNTTAAASYLNIAEDDFVSPQVQGLFASALYQGPFSDCRKWWWRRRLDHLVKTGVCGDGLELAHKNNMNGIRPCLCSHENAHNAGYYDMISEKPICKEHSRGGISWFPGGADLARISNVEYKKIGPFLGLY